MNSRVSDWELEQLIMYHTEAPGHDSRVSLALRELVDLRAEVARLREDAGRYRVLRGNPSLGYEKYEAVPLQPNEIDAATDAEIRASGPR